MNYSLKIIALLLLCLSAFQSQGQKLKEYYTARPQINGILYHIFPVSLFTNKANGDLTFDITYQQYQDSAILNFTYYNSQPTPIDSICLVTPLQKVSHPTTKLFIEAENNKKWKHRYSAKIPITFLYTFFRQETNPEIKLYPAEKSVVYILHKSEWKQKSASLNTILQTIQLESQR